LNPKGHRVSFLADGMFVPGSGLGSATSTRTDKSEDGVIASERRNGLFLPLDGPGNQRGFWNKAPPSSAETWQGASADQAPYRRERDSEDATRFVYAHKERLRISRHDVNPIRRVSLCQSCQLALPEPVVVTQEGCLFAEIKGPGGQAGDVPADCE
jgi:hypothetical protein